MSKRKPRRPKSRSPHRTAYFIKRKSLVDDTEFFSDEGKRIYFDKLAWAAWLVGSPGRQSNFTPEQEAHIVQGPVFDKDVDYRVWLPHVLPETVTVNEYLAAIETTMRDILRGRDLSGPRARRYLKQLRAQYARWE